MNHFSHVPKVAARRNASRMLLGGAMLATVAAGLALPSVASADGCAALAVHAGMSPAARSIALLEGQDSAYCPTEAGAGFVPMTPSQRSIQIIESKEAPGGILAGIPAPPRRVAFEDSEHAVAQTTDATAHLAPQPESPHAAAY